MGDILFLCWLDQRVQFENKLSFKLDCVNGGWGKLGNAGTFVDRNSVSTGFPFLRVETLRIMGEPFRFPHMCHWHNSSPQN